MSFDRYSPEYKTAFEAYMRKGIPIEHTLSELTLKMGGASEKKPTSHYIWRTRQDGKVRSSHAANHGKIFAWDNLPSTGHPGEDYGCRCTAEPYYPAITEYFDIQFSGISDMGPKWGNYDFVKHYFSGEGKPVRLRDTGHLTAVTNEYRKIVIDDISRLPSQIAMMARVNIDQSFGNTFRKDYNFVDVVFSLGNSVVEGSYSGYCKDVYGALHLKGSMNFYFSDKFEDVTGIRRHLRLLDKQIDQKEFGELPFSETYEIIDSWQGAFKAVVYRDPDKSRYAAS